jgi:lipooligosaccharide transport system permease protein
VSDIGLMPPSAFHLARRVWAREAHLWRAGWRSSIGTKFLEAWFYVAAFAFGIGQFVDLGPSTSYAMFVAPGILAATSGNIVGSEALFETWNNLHERKTFEALVTTPVTVADLVVGQLMWAATRGVIQGSVVLSVMVMAGLVTSPWALLLPVAFVFLGPAFAAPAMAWSAHARRFGVILLYSSLIEAPMFYFSGAFFPVSSLPLVAQAPVRLLPMYHGVSLVRGLSTGNLSLGLVANAATLLAYGLVFGYVAGRAFAGRLQD